MAAYKVQDERAGCYKLIEHELQYKNLVIDYGWIANNIATIYPNNGILWYHYGPGLHFTKLLEELAELHQALSKFEGGEERIDNVSTELADVFAWIVAIWQLAIPGKNFQEEFITHYYEGCPVCTTFPCLCASRKERRSGIIALPQLRELSKRMDDLSEVLGARKSELVDLRKSIEKAIESQNEQVAVQAVAQTKDKMESIRKTISDVDETGKKAVSIIDTASGIATRLLSLVEIIRPFIGP
jgi:predicted DNA-binding protein